MARRIRRRRLALLIVAGLAVAAFAPVAVFRAYYARAGTSYRPPAAMLLPSLGAPAPGERTLRARASRSKPIVRFAPVRAPAGHPFAWPVLGSHVITSPFGPRGNGFHHGTDIACALGQPVYASRGGRVIFAGQAKVYGGTVLIDHGGRYQTLYAHLSRIDVAVGQRVGALQQIGLCGATGDATGPHVHFEVRYDGYVWDPVSFLP